MRTCRQFTAEFKAKTALGEIEGYQPVAELATKDELRPTPDCGVQSEAIEAGQAFDDKGAEFQAIRGHKTSCRDRSARWAGQLPDPPVWKLGPRSLRA